MPRTFRCLAAGLVLLAALAACDSGKKGATPVPDPSGSRTGGASTAAGQKGSGNASITVGATQKKFSVTCLQSARATQATGNEGSDATTLTVKGTPIAAVLVSHDPSGATTIYQAIAGLRDDNGKAVGAITVTGSGNSYSGTGTFVLTKLDNKGKRVKLSTGSTAHGAFQLTCQGFAPAPTPSAPSSPAAKSASPKPTGTKKS